MDKIEKILNKLSPKERKRVKDILLKIDSNDFQNLDIKKLKTRDDIFRIRKGDIRIILCKKENSINVLSIERRGSKTYKKR